jgi:chemotaxis response regulator CheB
MTSQEMDTMGQPIHQFAQPLPVELKLQTQLRNVPPEAVPIVCIGLSAGGIEPLRTIFKRLAPTTGMTF